MRRARRSGRPGPGRKPGSDTASSEGRHRRRERPPLKVAHNPAIPIGAAVMPRSPWDRLDRALIRRALSGHANLLATPAPAERTAAVSLLLVPAADGVEVLMIRRASREGDPWSQHMALPGGFRSPSDADLFATALRETREEVAVDLATDTEALGVLPDVN